VTVTVEGSGEPRRVRLSGAKTAVDGRDALAARLVPPPPVGAEDVLLVADGPLADGVGVDVRAGTPDAPGEMLAAGRLHDPVRPG
jgi:hypothetical protein